MVGRGFLLRSDPLPGPIECQPHHRVPAPERFSRTLDEDGATAGRNDRESRQDGDFCVSWRSWIIKSVEEPQLGHCLAPAAMERLLWIRRRHGSISSPLIPTSLPSLPSVRVRILEQKAPKATKRISRTRELRMS